ncbi:MAG: tetratricopeptide repeat protein [Sedimentisphaerales bacterium]|jgi:tetratricopeptide (TPR) repeat protein
MKSSQKHIVFVVIVALVIATLVAYEPIRHNGFVNYDDNGYIVYNNEVQSGITWESLGQAFTKPHLYMWHPLTTISHMLDYEIFGLNPQGHHLVSVAIHIVNALLLFWVLNNLTGTIWPGAFVAAVFALHPLQAESVAWAAERKTVISGLFWLLTMAAYIHYARKPGFGRYLIVLVVFGLCIMTKPTVITLPLVLLLLDYWPLDRIRWGHQHNDKTRSRPYQKSIGWLTAEKIPLLAISAILGVLTFITQKSGQVVISLDRIPLDHRIANAFVSYVKYISKLVWPSDLAVFYPLSHLNLFNTTTVICAFIFILISAISIYIGRRKKYIAVGWLWFAGTLVPMIGLVQAGGQAMANRYMYLSMLGLLIIIALAGKELIATQPRLKIIAVVMSVILLSCLLVLTRMQVQHWRNSITLFEYTLSVTKDNASAENSYGCALFNEDRISEAERHFGNALRIDPGFDPALPNLARTYMKEGKYNEAIPVYEELIKRNYKNAELYYNLAMAFGMQEKYNDSIKYFNKSLELNPSDPDTHKQLGITLLAAGKTDEAIGQFNESLRIKADQSVVYENLGTAYGQLGKYEPAVQNWTRAIELNPDNIDALDKAGWFLAVRGKVSAEKANQAIAYAQRVCELTKYTVPAHLDTLGAAYAAAGRFAEAKATAEKALKLSRETGQGDLADAIENRIKLYEAGQPYREK